MSALGRVAAQCGIAAMQSINVTVLNPLFFTVFGTAVLSLVLAIAALLGWSEPGAFLFIGGEPTLSPRLYFRDDGLQRTAQQQTRVRQARKRRRCERVDALLVVLDVLESRTDGRLSCRSRAVYRGPRLVDDPGLAGDKSPELAKRLLTLESTRCTARRAHRPPGLTHRPPVITRVRMTEVLDLHFRHRQTLHDLDSIARKDHKMRMICK